MKMEDSTRVDRRSFITGTLAGIACPARVLAGSGVVVDAAGRDVPIPSKVERIFPAGPPAAILLYTLAPQLLLGWPRANGVAERAFLLPEVGARPELGRLTGRGNTANLELVLQLKPDLILDVGTTTATYVSLADRVQSQTGIPYALLNGRLDAAARTYQLLGRLIHHETAAGELAGHAERTLDTMRRRLQSVPPDTHPRVYYARGQRGLETALAGSINIEAIETMGARNVAGAQSGGLATVSLEQVLAWDPEVIVTIDRDFARNVLTDPDWASVAAIRNGRVHLSPKLPFGWVDFPPSVNRLIGLWWLGKILYPDLFPEDLRPLARDFYARFYHVDVTDEQLSHLLAGGG
jgi:iron complex transport system substrate-binding protein